MKNKLADNRDTDLFFVFNAGEQTALEKYNKNNSTPKLLYEHIYTHFDASFLLTRGQTATDKKTNSTGRRASVSKHSHNPPTRDTYRAFNNTFSCESVPYTCTKCDCG